MIQEDDTVYGESLELQINTNPKKRIPMHTYTPESPISSEHLPMLPKAFHSFLIIRKSSDFFFPSSSRKGSI